MGDPGSRFQSYRLGESLESNKFDDLDPQFRAIVVAPRGGVDYSEIGTDRITIEPFMLAVYPKVHVQDVATRRFQILDREQEKGQVEIARLEDTKVFSAFKSGNVSVPDNVNQGVVNSVVTGTNGLDPDTCADAFSKVEQYDIPVTNMIVNARQNKDLRLWTNRNFDPVNMCCGLN